MARQDESSPEMTTLYFLSSSSLEIPIFFQPCPTSIGQVVIWHHDSWLPLVVPRTRLNIVGLLVTSLQDESSYVTKSCPMSHGVWAVLSRGLSHVTTTPSQRSYFLTTTRVEGLQVKGFQFSTGFLL
ncbi:hypothetical protein HAX54_037339 [Datura stramonium]|uniref:Uncharacterized protein n=1 Tax=Datura stramonium TaxID=4076 RepID=A0ABS8RMK7_DATST|nr:hypothetical protein [Datura stramonium]